MKIKVGDWRANEARVFVDGVEAKYVVEASEEGSWVREFATDSAGRIRIAKDRDSDVIRMRSGAVQVRFPEGT